MEFLEFCPSKNLGFHQEFFLRVLFLASFQKILLRILLEFLLKILQEFPLGIFLNLEIVQGVLLKNINNSGDHPEITHENRSETPCENSA